MMDDATVEKILRVVEDALTESGSSSMAALVRDLNMDDLIRVSGVAHGLESFVMMEMGARAVRQR